MSEGLRGLCLRRFDGDGLTILVGIERCRRGLAGAGIDLAVENPVVELVDRDERHKLDIIEAPPRVFG